MSDQSYAQPDPGTPEAATCVCGTCGHIYSTSLPSCPACNAPNAKHLHPAHHTDPPSNPSPMEGGVVVPDQAPRQGRPKRSIRLRFGFGTQAADDALREDTTSAWGTSKTTGSGIVRSETKMSVKIVNGQLACPGCQNSYPATAEACTNCGKPNPVKEIEKLYGGPIPGLG